VTNLPEISVQVAEAVYQAAIADGGATKTHDDISHAIQTTVLAGRL
jgi:malate dehydrogenase (oxaloacetate-decarboxylating)